MSRSWSLFRASLVLGIILLLAFASPAGVQANEAPSVPGNSSNDSGSDEPTLESERSGPAPPLRATLTLPIPSVQLSDIAPEAIRSLPGLGSVRAPESIDLRSEQKWIEVDLSEQRLYAHEGNRVVREFVVSTGLPGTATVSGVYRIWTRTRVQDMSGGSRAAGTDYYLPDVEWVQYFYEDYAFHGTYWHNNFGNPMSHGCVNMTNEDAEWLFRWTMPEWDGEWGWLRSSEETETLVFVHQ